MDLGEGMCGWDVISKGLGSPTLTALQVVAHTASCLSWLCSFLMSSFCRRSMLLAFSASWGVCCILGYILTPWCTILSGSSGSDHDPLIYFLCDLPGFFWWKPIWPHCSFILYPWKSSIMWITADIPPAQAVARSHWILAAADWMTWWLNSRNKLSQKSLHFYMFVWSPIFLSLEQNAWYNFKARVILGHGFRGFYPWKVGSNRMVLVEVLSEVWCSCYSEKARRVRTELIHRWV